MGKVTVVGSYIVALVMDVDRIPLEGETLVGRNYHTTHGGKGSNMAVCAARLGADAAFLGKIGRDAFGDGFLRLLDREGVRKGSVLRSESVPTAVGFIVWAMIGSAAHARVAPRMRRMGDMRAMAAGKERDYTAARGSPCGAARSRNARGPPPPR